MSIKDIINKVKQYPCKLVQVTGGEPLFQKNCIILLRALVKEQYKILLETSGSLSIQDVPKEVINIIDFKCPSSKMQKKNLWDNLDYVKSNDQIKFVIGNKEDYDWTKSKIYKYNLEDKCELLISPVYGNIKSEKIVNWILEDNLKVRFQIQLHKEIWPEEKRGV